jgi:L-amino acid N-acyltransferase YncA/RimJ/RimL family protein N-acetyltransferase
MGLAHINIQPADPLRHFAAIAALMSSQETEPTTQQSLTEWYSRQLGDGIQLMVAVSQADKVLGFNSIYRENLNYEQLYGIYLIVEQDYQLHGLGSQLYDDLLGQAIKVGARTLKTRVRDTNNDGIRFANKRGFVEKKHSIEMMFDLSTWDDARYEPSLYALQAQGFRFTNMAELGDTQEARRKLYTLNSTAAATDPGSDGVPPWASFEDFNKNVCNTSWYHPDGQIVAIDTHTGEWAAMSAVTVFAGADHAYNLFTGTNVRYRGRKLAQAVKALALRKARTFGVDTVRTSHNSENVAMIAIDTKLGYVSTPGTLIMEKEMENARTQI